MKMTIKEAQTRASSLLNKHHIQQAELEAEVMIRALYQWERSQFFLHLHEDIVIEKNVQLTNWIERRINHEPLQYIIGYQDFYGRTFHVNPNVLIPRPETEQLVESVLQEADILFGNQSITAIDVGTGSGAIAITVALERKAWKVHTVDISDKAVEVATVNAERLKADVIFHQGNLLQPFIDKHIKGHLIISNPPYIPTQDISGLMQEVRDYEPILALDGGEDGLDFYRRIIYQKKEVLHKPGLIAFEIGINQSEQIKNVFKASGASQTKIIADFQEIPRIVIAKYL